MHLNRSQESRVRRLARREGYIVRKSRRFDPIHNQGEFMLVDASLNIVAIGSNYDAALDEVEAFLRD